jgi:hypothetical protein
MTFIPPINNQMPLDGTLVANAGRFGDTFVRNVHGAPSHVNQIEAKVIDNLGLLGQNIVKNTRPPGTETVNPVTGMDEYFPWGALISAGISAYQMNNSGGISDTALADKFDNYKTRLDTLDTRADDMMDPNSSYNQGLINDANKRNFDNLAFTNMMTSRGDAAGGVAGYSGIQNQQNQANLDKVQAMNADMANQLQQHNLTQGTNLKNQVLGGYQQYDSMFAQKAANEAAHKQLMAGQLIGGLAGGIGYGSLKDDINKAGDPTGDLGKTFEWMSDDQFDMRNQALADNPWIEQEQDPDYDFWEDESNFAGGNNMQQLMQQYPHLLGLPGLMPGLNSILGALTGGTTT